MISNRHYRNTVMQPARRVAADPRTDLGSHHAGHGRRRQRAVSRPAARAGAVRGRWHRGDRRHRDQTRRKSAGRPAEHYGLLDGRHREDAVPRHGRLHEGPAECVAGQQHAGPELPGDAGHHDRCLRIPDGQPGRGLPRRTACHVDLAAARDPDDRHRARRIAAGPAGHAVRLELAVGHAAHHHQQAELRRLLGPGRRHDRIDQGRRRELRRQRASQHPTGRRQALAPRAVGFWSDEGGWVDNVEGPTHRGSRRLRQPGRQFGDRQGQPERLRRVRRPYRGAVEHQRQLDRGSELHPAEQRGRRHLGNRPVPG